MVCDVGRFQYRASCRYDGGATFEREWYFADPGAKCLPVPSAFGSSRFNIDAVDVNGIGEVWQRNPPLSSGKRNPKLTGGHYCGSPDQWLNGWPVGYGTGDVNECCPLQGVVKVPAGGVLVGGAALVAHPVYETGAGGILAGGASSWRVATWRVYGSGGILVGGWTPSSGGILVGGVSTHAVKVPVMAVTSVGLRLPPLEFDVTGSPVVDVGVLEGDWVVQLANTFFAGPTDGDADTPAFRLLTDADVGAVHIPASNLVGPGKIPAEVMPAPGNRVIQYDLVWNGTEISIPPNAALLVAPILKGTAPVRIWAQVTEAWGTAQLIQFYAFDTHALTSVYSYNNILPAVTTLQVNFYSRTPAQGTVPESSGNCSIGLIVSGGSYSTGKISVWVEWFDSTGAADGGSGGAAIEPSDSVADETTYGLSHHAGTALTYSRGDHTHGSPDLPSAAEVGADPAGAAAAAQTAANAYTDGKGANSVTAGTSYGKVPAPGTLASYSRGDHTHGTPPLPSASQVGADPAGAAATAQANAKAYTDAQLAGISGGGQPADPTLSALAGLVVSPNSLILGTGADEFAILPFPANTFPGRSSAGDVVAQPITDYALDLVTAPDAATARTKLGVSAATSSLQRGFLDGGMMSTNGSNVVTFGKTECRDDANTATWATAAMTKILDPSRTFIAGPGQPILDAGAPAGATAYYVFCIRNSSNNQGDYIASTSPTAPALSAPFDKSRRIGWFYTGGAQAIDALFTRPGGDFVWSAGLFLDFTAPFAAGVSQLHRVNAPIGFPVLVTLSLSASAVTAIYVSSPDVQDQAVAVLGPVISSVSITVVNATGTTRVWTDANGMVRFVTGAAATVRCSTVSWLDPRGRDSA